MRERDCPEGPVCLQAAKVITCNFEGGGIIYRGGSRTEFLGGPLSGCGQF